MMWDGPSMWVIYWSCEDVAETLPKLSDRNSQFLSGLNRFRSSRAESQNAKNPYSLRFCLAGELGFEPRQTESESVVLPLHHSPINPSIFRKLHNCVS